MREQKVYTTQYGYYWSMPFSKWKEICHRVINGGGFNYDKEEGVKALKYKPKDTRYLYDTLDWKDEQWALGLWDLTGKHICLICKKETVYWEVERCGVCEGCEHCCESETFRACKEEED